MKQQKTEWPLWVRLALWKIPNRKSAMMFVWGTMSIVLISLLGLYFDKRFKCGSAFFIASLWYWLAIQWVDKNGDRNSSWR